MLLADTGMGHMKHPVLFILREMDRLRNNLDMASSDMDYAEKKISALAVKTKGISHAKRALSVASEGVAVAREHYFQAEEAVIKGIEKSMAWCRAGRHSALEKPFPIQAAEQRLDGVKKCLHGAFIAMDLGIGRTEEAEGMTYCDGIFWKYDSGLPWADFGGDPALINILMYMRDSEMEIKQAYESAHQTALRTDGFRPKGHVKIVYSPLKAGWHWEKEKAERLERQKEAGQAAGPPEMPPREETAGKSAGKKAGPDAAKGKQAPKPSLQKRLKVAEKNSRLRYAPISTDERGSKVSETQR